MTRLNCTLLSSILTLDMLTSADYSQVNVDTHWHSYKLKRNSNTYMQKKLKENSSFPCNPKEYLKRYSIQTLNWFIEKMKKRISKESDIRWPSVHLVSWHVICDDSDRMKWPSFLWQHGQQTTKFKEIGITCSVMYPLFRDNKRNDFEEET